MKNTKYIILFYFVLYVLLYFFTLNLNYVEGDDAATILYHLCGRNNAIAPPYAAYNSGLDYLLTLTGYTSEINLREFAVLVSFFTGFLILSLYALFLDAFFETETRFSIKNKHYFYLLLPFVIPDIIFHSLIINATNISFVFLLSSLIFHLKFLKTNRNKFLVITTFLFAFAIPFRWTMLIALPLYIGLALYFNPIEKYSKHTYHLFFKIAMANVIGVLLAVIFIYVTGYSFQGVIDTFVSAKNALDDTQISVFAKIATSIAFFTPSVLFLILLGIIKIYELHRKGSKISFSILAFVILSLSPCLIVGLLPSYKFLITLLPILLLIMVLGFDYLATRRFLQLIFLLLVALPWFVGIQLNFKGTFCGPGFELNTNKIKENDNPTTFSYSPDKRMSFDKVNINCQAGFYMPTLEGPRPLYGYFYVLFGNGWKHQIDLFTQERERTFELLVKYKNSIYIQDRSTAYFQCDLFRKGLVTKTGFIKKDSLLSRNFKNDYYSIDVNFIPDVYPKAQWIKNYFKTSNKTVLYRSSYSNEILELYLGKSIPLEIVGPFTVIKQ